MTSTKGKIQTPICLTSDVMIFEPPSIQYGVEDTSYQLFYPVNGVNNSVIEFCIQNLQRAHLDLYCSFVSLTVRIVRDDGEEMDEKDVVFPINHLLSGMFKTVTVYANNKLVGSNELYAYRSILDVVLHSTPAAQETVHAAGLYVEDDEHLKDDYDVSSRGPKQRYEATKGGKYFNLVGQINTDLFQQPRLMVPAVEIRVVFLLNNDEFKLVSVPKDKKTYNYEVDIKEMTLHLKKVTLAPSLFLEYERRLQTTPAIYVLRGLETKVRSLSAGSLDAHFEDVYPERVPSKLCVALLATSDFLGDI
ncbi:uncharacterized protein LOC135391796 isoform X2 [Ornithodoros turicata]|uniref:uncharacterized protein LOC135391796 isoform X2 n=1 Tax=Ornithodoros turicata TaxID=34597 RepID=UPI00313A1368